MSTPLCHRLFERPLLLFAQIILLSLLKFYGPLGLMIFLADLKQKMNRYISEKFY
jgi:hypothetical protein